MNLSDLLHRWRALTRKDNLDHELDEELRFHLERDVEQNIRNGMSPQDARYAALKSFGGVDQSKEECRDAPGGVHSDFVAAVAGGVPRVLHPRTTCGEGGSPRRVALRISSEFKL